MSIDWFADVLDFHHKTGLLVNTVPTVPDPDTVELRENLIYEEFNEVEEALASGDLSKIAKEIVDLVYVLEGTAVSYGIDLRRVWEEVHRSNMQKAGGPRREDGKILKPKGWIPPDIVGVLEKQEPIV